MRHLLRFVSVVFALALIAPSTALGAEDVFPSRTIHIVTPVPPGASPLDFAARQMKEILAEKLGWQIVVENVTGASGEIAAQRCALAAKDGYTVCLLHTGALVAGPIDRAARGDGLLYNPLSAFDLLASDAKHTHALVARAKVGSSLADVLQYARKHGPIRIGYHFQNSNTAAHLLASLLTVTNPVTSEKKKLGDPVLSSKAGGDAGQVADLLSPNEDVQIAFMNIAAVRPHLSGGKVVVVGVLGLNRSPFLPHVPTLHEQPQGEIFGEVIGWTAYSVPAGVPKDRKETLTRELLEAMKDPRYVKTLEDTWAEPFPRGPEAIRAQLEHDITWYKAYKAGPLSR